jgi:hypothetical protein
VQQIADWLGQLGLGQYAQRFAENEIDVSVLRHLTDQDLKDIGIPLGHRRKLLAAISELGSAAPAPAPPAAAAAPPIAAAVEAAGERRYLTVMFCDLVDSTGISAQLDAEEWRDLVGAYLDAASAAVTEMSGHVAKKLGDGLLALFGYPVAQENDSERAARAALSIQRALAELNRKNAGAGKPALNARIGIETGALILLACAWRSTSRSASVSQGRSTIGSSQDWLVTRILPSGAGTATSESLSVLAWIWLMDPDFLLFPRGG